MSCPTLACPDTNHRQDVAPCTRPVSSPSSNSFTIGWDLLMALHKFLTLCLRRGLQHERSQDRRSRIFCWHAAVAVYTSLTMDAPSL